MVQPPLRRWRVSEARQPLRTREVVDKPTRRRFAPSYKQRIVGNAVKFTEEGEVRVTMEKVQDLDDGVELRFEVRDTGIGIPADKVDYIFESFHQADGSTSRRFGGTGLGLSIASGIVNMMGGEIRVESEEGVGSRFHFTARFTLGQQASRPPKLPSADLQGLHVLVVDDNETNRRVLDGFLGRMKMDTVCAASGVEALQILDQTHGSGEPMDMAILDVHMPEMDGFELAEQIREDDRFGDLVLVTITSAGRPGDGAVCEKLGLSSYLLKPITPTELRDADPTHPRPGARDPDRGQPRDPPTRFARRGSPFVFFSPRTIR